MRRLFLFFFLIKLSLIAFGQRGNTDLVVSNNYTFTGSFPKENLNLPFNGNALNHHRIFIDPTGERTIADLRIQDKHLNWQNPFKVNCEAGKVYWLKATFKGSPHFNGSQLLHIAPTLGKDEFSFDYIDAYIFKSNGTQLHQRTGNKIALRERPINFWASLIQLELQPKDSLELWVRMEGADRQFKMRQIGLYHIDVHSLFSRQVNYAWINGFFYGILGIQFFFFLLLFFMEKDRIHLYFCIFIVGYLLMVGYSIENFNQFIPFSFLIDERFTWVNIGAYIVIFGGLKFTQTYFNYSKKSIYSKWIIPSLLVLSTFVIVSAIFNFNRRGLKGILVLLFASCVILMAFNVRKKYPKLLIAYFLAFLPNIIIFCVYFILKGFNFSFLENQEWLLSFFTDLFKIGGVWMITFFTFSIGNRTNQLKEEKTKALQKNLAAQQNIHQAISRFVPNEFLQALGKADITEVKLGDNIQKEVTIFVSDIRDFTALSEQLSPAENFLFVKDYNTKMGPIIQAHDGFVNQYLGDGMMAIFPHSPDRAIRAAIQMQHSLQLINKERMERGQRAINVGMGLHTGPLIMGITGDKNRLGTATISNSVNSATHIESLTKQFGVSILLSEACLEKLPDDHTFNLRYLGSVKVKGKELSLKIYDCFDGDDSAMIAAKVATQIQFETGVYYYEKQDYQAAIPFFEAVLAANPKDRAAKLFLEKAEKVNSAI